MQFIFRNILRLIIINMNNNILTKIIKINGKYTGLHKTLSDTEFLKFSYNNIKVNKGINTPGFDNETFDGFQLSNFDKLAKSVYEGSYKPKPIKRILIPKPNSDKKRPLGIPSSMDKIVQEGIRILLEFIYEPKFLDNSHGFRPNRSCHSALNFYKMKFNGTSWIINMDIMGCFDRINHEKLIFFLKKEIDDKPFFDLMWKLFNAGVTFEEKLIFSKEGTPQGSIMSPVLCNIYLNELDIFVNNLKKDFDIGIRRRANPEYTKIIRKGVNSSKFCRKKSILPLMQDDVNFKRLHYVRYADDFLIGIDGSQEEALFILERIKVFLLNDLLFELKPGYGISHFRSERVKFLGVYLCGVEKNKVSNIKYINDKVARCSPRPQILLPIIELRDKLLELGFSRRVGNELKPTRNGKLIHSPVNSIIDYYNWVYRGLCGYYAICNNKALLSRFHYFIKYSLALTLASKLRLKTIKKVFDKFGFDITNIDSQNEKRTLVSSDYWKNLKNLKKDMLYPDPLLNFKYKFRLYEKASCLSTCEICGCNDNLEIHHKNPVRNIKSNDFLVQRSVLEKRKTLILCKKCHIQVHKGDYNGRKL